MRILHEPDKWNAGAVFCDDNPVPGGAVIYDSQSPNRKRKILTNGVVSLSQTALAFTAHYQERQTSRTMCIGISSGL
ncbi:hypothetical protein Pst134EA_007519 [Puccinia striiformis f. sp. tritici]|uniref:hypothetical protein n=1 Tax=Puccinia striiformis f. sp. tritici TaxID=168172 RepID=UPI0020079661|nr:hypothetical protein Pst134EA_007519 [Puccinia striiformis f. sp. tritici]KAH9470253.1 hypothetical protein Pst134EA_007519 [Puccinia striiformis f. sp. tritici]KAI9619870.1 hypothetical protein KEM48_008484 [Puccinia striiformis f. sp. tritici PST-130]